MNNIRLVYRPFYTRGRAGRDIRQARGPDWYVTSVDTLRLFLRFLPARASQQQTIIVIERTRI